jgi:4-hydroxy-2-oxoheptanedioate aldolase
MQDSISVILDREHGPANWETLMNHGRGARASGLHSIIRVGTLDANEIGSALDCGVDGVQVPNVNTPAQAKAAIEAARFHPLGKRGVCRFVRGAQYGATNKSEYFHEANTKTLILQVEGTKGIANLDQILALEGFDVLFIGPYDLSQSLGVPGEIQHPKVLEKVSEIAEKVQKKGLVLGTFCDDPKKIGPLLKQGFHYISYSVDLNIFQESLLSLMTSVKGV